MCLQAVLREDCAFQSVLCVCVLCVYTVHSTFWKGNCLLDIKYIWWWNTQLNAVIPACRIQDNDPGTWIKFEAPRNQNRCFQAPRSYSWMILKFHWVQIVLFIKMCFWKGHGSKCWRRSFLTWNDREWWQSGFWSAIKVNMSVFRN